MPETIFKEFQAVGDVPSDAWSYVRFKDLLITGVTQGGLGAEVALQISYHHPSRIILAGRNIAKLRVTEATLKDACPTTSIRLLELDLSSQAQIRKASEEVNAYGEPIDVLINNAAIMAVPYAKTVDGVESQFGTNHIGHFLFTNLIMPKLLAAKRGARVLNNGAVYDKWKAYGQSKTANMLFSVSLAQKLASKGLLSFSLYPGRVKTNIVQSIPFEELRAAG
ncbi:hypothetical protein MMC28_009650 [Mycoblastus sanguinarius]|nr:hypothetical protein [Mycoblastus sanguinarius]